MTDSGIDYGSKRKASSSLRGSRKRGGGAAAATGEEPYALDHHNYQTVLPAATYPTVVAGAAFADDDAYNSNDNANNDVEYFHHDNNDGQHDGDDIVGQAVRSAKAKANHAKQREANKPKAYLVGKKTIAAQQAERESQMQSADDDDDKDAKKRSSAGNARGNNKRQCRFPGCERTIKSQGFCQRHGAVAKRCKVEGCDKQAQGTHQGMCKRHYHATFHPEKAMIKAQKELSRNPPPPPPSGVSVYESVLPLSVSYKPLSSPSPDSKRVREGTDKSNDNNSDNDAPLAAGVHVMPLVAFLKEGSMARMPSGWHRSAERRARGMHPAPNLSTQLEPWEKQLAMMEILLLSGGTPYANFTELAHAWGREKGFHHVLIANICERKGNVERKKRKDAGKVLTEEQKQNFRGKLIQTRTQKKKQQGGEDDGDDDDDDGEEEENNDGEDGAGTEVGGKEDAAEISNPEVRML